MAKITLDTILSSFASTSLFNTNFTAIQNELNNKVLYRNNPTGEANQMLNDLDMNSNDILNASSVNADVIVLNGTQITPTGTTNLPASGLTYDNTTSGLTATNVQAAIDEVEGRVDTAETDITTVEVQQAKGLNHGKNLVINGDFSIWQRGTNQTTSGYGSDDRFVNVNTGSTKTHSQQVFSLGQTDVPNNPKYYSRTVVSSVVGASNRVRKDTTIEDVTKLSGEEVTLSFWAKADAAKDIATSFTQNFGSGGSPSAAVSGISVTTHSLTTSWQKFTVTTTLPSVSGKTLGTNNNSYTQVEFWFDAGTSFDSQTNSLGQQSGTFDISNVQLEFGDTATEFEYVSPADQLARCQRYFQKSYNMTTDPGTITISGRLQQDANGTVNQINSARFNTPMRVSPAIVLYSPATGASGVIDIGGDVTVVSESIGETGFSYYGVTTPPVGTNIRSHFTADAEL